MTNKTDTITAVYEQSINSILYKYLDPDKFDFEVTAIFQNNINFKISFPSLITFLSTV